MQIFRQFTANNITLQPYPFLKELAMEAYLIENESILQLDESDFSDVEILDAEIALKEGRKSANRDGRIDILARYGADYLGIVELKLEELKLEHLEQLEDYLDQNHQILEKYPEYWKEETKKPKWIGILVGKSADKGLLEKLKSGYKFNGEIPIGIITLNRFRNRQSNEIIVVSDSYFNFSYSSKDYSKFKFNGLELNKSQLVNEVLSYYANIKPELTYNDLEFDFPKSIQGSLGVFATLETAELIKERTGHRRHYIDSQKIIDLADCQIASCTEWNKDNIAKFINRAKELGLKID
jgi:hypothetical protein